MDSRGELSVSLISLLISSTWGAPMFFGTEMRTVPDFLKGKARTLCAADGSWYSCESEYCRHVRPCPSDPGLLACSCTKPTLAVRKELLSKETAKEAAKEAPPETKAPRTKSAWNLAHHLHSQCNKSSSNPLSDQERLEFYLGEWSACTTAVNTTGDTTLCNHRLDMQQFKGQTRVKKWNRTYPIIPQCNAINTGQLVCANRGTKQGGYVGFKELLPRVQKSQMALAVLGDTPPHKGQPALPVIAKDRWVGSRTSIIWKLDRGRNYAFAQEIPDVDLSHDISFQQKKDIAVWRGASTGPASHYAPDFHGERHQRPALAWRIKSLAGNPMFNVGLSPYVQKVKPDPNRYGKTSRMSASEQLKNKIIMIAEGNAGASGLGWALASNSVVVMPPPTMSSWRADELLVPWYHYIPVHQNWTNLEENVQWCFSHVTECEAISQRASCFISVFVDKKTEERLMSIVLSTALNLSRSLGVCALC